MKIRMFINKSLKSIGICTYVYIIYAVFLESHLYTASLDLVDLRN